MKCKKCGTDDWYERGRYKRCRQCHRETMLRSYHNRRLGITKTSKQARPRNFSKDLAVLDNPTAIAKRLQTTCVRGHELSPDNVRIDVDSKGRQHRRCRKCERVKNHKKYGIPTPSDMKDLLASTINPWEQIE
jgi:hypothetical protein